MTSINLAFFCEQPVLLNGQPVKLPYVKAEGVLYCLAADGIVKKERLCDIFWGDSPEELSKKSLRNAVYALRKALGEAVIESSAHDSLQLGSAYSIETDLKWLEQTGPVPGENLAGFLAFYQQDFLAKLGIRGAEGYSDWLLLEQGNYREAYLARLERTAEELAQNGNWEGARRCYEKMIRLDSYQELPYQKLIELLLQHNRRQEAIKIYAQLEALLKEELFIRPSKGLTDLVEGALLKPGNAASETPFFGRGRERRQLRQFYQTFLAGKGPKNFCLLGEPGVGKSALLSAWKAEIGDACFVLSENSYYSEKDYPYKLWHSVCAQLLAMAKSKQLSLDEELLQSMQQLQPDMNDMEEITGAAGGTISRMDYFILRLLRYVCGIRPVVLIVDDLQWIDGRSLQLLFRVLAGNGRIMLAAASRDDQTDNVNQLCYSLSGSDSLQLLSLDRFNSDETRELLHCIAPEFQNLHEIIYRESEGNAFFIIEAVRNLSCGLQVDILSPDINNFIGARLSGLDKSVRAIANLVATMQNDMSLQLLQVVSGVDRLEVVDAVDKLLSLGILREFVDAKGDICYCFTHQKLREHIYNSISLSKRALLHEKIANGIETLCADNSEAYLPMGLLLYHYSLADNLYKIVTLRLDRQERIAKRRYEMFRLDVAEPGWNVNFFDDSAEDTERELQEIHDLLHNPRLRCDKEKLTLLHFRYAYLLGRLRYSQGRYEEGKAAVENMLSFARALHKEEYLADAYLRMILQSVDNCELDNMKRYIGLAESLPSYQANPSFGAMVRHYKAVLFLRQGRLAESEALLDENTAILEKLPVEWDVDGQLAMNFFTRSTIALQKKDLEEAEPNIRMARKFCRNVGDEPGAAMLNLNEGRLHYARAEYGEALEELQRAEAFFAQSAFLENRGDLYSALALTCLALDKREAAAQYGRICGELLPQLKIAFERTAVEECLQVLKSAGILREET